MLHDLWFIVLQRNKCPGCFINIWHCLQKDIPSQGPVPRTSSVLSRRSVVGPCATGAALLSRPWVIICVSDMKGGGLSNLLKSAVLQAQISNSGVFSVPQPGRLQHHASCVQC